MHWQRTGQRIYSLSRGTVGREGYGRWVVYRLQTRKSRDDQRRRCETAYEEKSQFGMEKDFDSFNAGTVIVD